MRTFVISRMYAGAYITNKMGGEIINLLHDDHNNNYIYVNPYGYIAKKYDNTVEGVLLTRLLKSGCFEVLGIAKIGKDGQLVFPEGNTTIDKMKSTGEQLLYKEKQYDIRYGGKKLSDIYNGQLNGALTFKSDVLLLPKDKIQIFITDSDNINFKPNENTYNLIDKRFPDQSLISYVTDNDNAKAFNMIQQIIDNKSLWDTNQKNTISQNDIIDKHYNFLKLIKKEDDELVYSNMFQYFFAKYPEMLKAFSENVLEVKLTGENIIVEREKSNIDLWIEDLNNIIIIENKIKSGISGVSPRHDFKDNGLIQSQLIKYYDYGENSKGSKKTHYFIFVPVYNRLNLKEYNGSKYYHKITYKDIFDFFDNYKNDDKYYNDFVNSLYKHTKDRAFDYYEDMKYRFIQILKK